MFLEDHLRHIADRDATNHEKWPKNSVNSILSFYVMLSEAACIKLAGTYRCLKDCNVQKWMNGKIS